MPNFDQVNILEVKFHVNTTIWMEYDVFVHHFTAQFHNDYYSNKSLNTSVLLERTLSV